VSNLRSGQGIEQQLHGVPVTKAKQQDVPSSAMERLARKAPRV